MDHIEPVPSPRFCWQASSSARAASARDAITADCSTSPAISRCRGGGHRVPQTRFWGKRGTDDTVKVAGVMPRTVEHCSPNTGGSGPGLGVLHSKRKPPTVTKL